MSQNLTFSFELAQQLYTSAEQFPIDFDDAWVWLGYATKQKALKKLNGHFEEGVDFLTDRAKSSKPSKGHPKLKIFLTLECFESLKAKKRLSPKAFERTEKAVQAKLVKQLKGKTEVPCIAGSIDILTQTEIIEVKSIECWKAAIGQILVYGHYYPSHQKRIHLFGETQESFLEMIGEHCKKLEIVLTWQV